MPNPGVWRGLQRPAQCGALALGCLALAHCGSQDQLTSRIDPKYGVASSPRVVEFGEAVPKGGGTYRIGKPYVVAGITYVPEENPNYRAEGLASFYGQDFHGRRTANGEVFDMEKSFGRASDPADSLLRPCHQPRQPQVGHCPGQRPRPLSRQSPRRRVDEDGSRSWIPSIRSCPGTHRIRWARFAGRLG